MRNPLDPLELVALNGQYVDPAVDDAEPVVDPATPPEQRPPSNAAMLARYYKTFDRRALRTKPGAEPAVFHCKHLPVALVFDVLDDLPDSRRLKTVFLLSCHRIALPGAPPMECGPTKPYAAGAGLVPANEDAWLEAVRARFGADTIRQIATMVYRAATEPLPEEQLAPFASRAG